MKTLIMPVVLVFSALWVSFVHAHDGPHGPDVLADVVAVHAEGNVITVDLRVTSVGGPLTLTGLYVDGATLEAFEPVILKFAVDVYLNAVFVFRRPPDPIFNLDLAFGELGQTRVQVRLE